MPFSPADSTNFADAQKAHILKEAETMNHTLFSITLLVTAILIILAACGVSAPSLSPATEPPIATEAISTVAETAATNVPEPTGTQVVLGVIESTIAFQSNRDGNDEIYLMNGDGSGLVNLTNNPADDFRPVWSPDGEKIIFASNRDGNKEIYMMNADGRSRLYRSACCRIFRRRYEYLREEDCAG